MSTDTPSGPSIPAKGWENPFPPGTFLHKQYGTIVEEHRDLIIILDDMKGRRGTGKTVASLQLAAALDQTPEGITWEKVAMRPEEIRNAYETQPLRSALVLDEAEFGVSNRQAMSKTNQALREILSMGRVEEKYLIVNAPLKKFIDRDVQNLSQVWISMQRKGRALVHHLDWETYNEKLLTRKKEHITFDDIPKNTPLRGVYNQLTEEKRAIIRGSEGDGWVPRDEHRDELRKAREEARLEARNGAIRGFYRHPAVQESGITQANIGEAVGLTQRQVSNIVNEEDSSDET